MHIVNVYYVKVYLKELSIVEKYTHCTEEFDSEERKRAQGISLE